MPSTWLRPSPGTGVARPTTVSDRLALRRVSQPGVVARSLRTKRDAFPLPVLPELEIVNSSYSEPTGALGRNLDTYA